MTTSQKLLVSAGIIALMSFLQIGIASQLLSETSGFSVRATLLMVLSAVQIGTGIWALKDVAKKIVDTSPIHRAAPHTAKPHPQPQPQPQPQHKTAK